MSELEDDWAEFNTVSDLWPLCKNGKSEDDIFDGT
jgi:hypothetical protein